MTQSKGKFAFKHEVQALLAVFPSSLYGQSSWVCACHSEHFGWCWGHHLVIAKDFLSNWLITPMWHVVYTHIGLCTSFTFSLSLSLDKVQNPNDFKKLRCIRRWKGGSRGRGHMYTYGWFMLMYGRNQHNIVGNYLPIKNKYIFLKKDAFFISSSWLWLSWKAYQNGIHSKRNIRQWQRRGVYDG